MFIETPRFPENISYGSSGGPTYSTSVEPSLSGRNTKNINWEYPLHRYNVGFGMRSHDDVETVLKLFHVCQGRANGFRYKDFADYKSSDLDLPIAFTDQVIGIGDGVQTAFQVLKNYFVGTNGKTRIITKTVIGTELFGVNGSIITPLSYDSTTGILIVSSPPALGVNVTAGFEFDVPCSFQSDSLNSNFENFSSSSVDVRIQEERL